MLSERLAAARRLELTDAIDTGDHIEAYFRGVKLTLEDHGLERTLRFDVDRPVKWVSIGARGKELNDPDVVTTADAAFDEAITVLAEDGWAPQVRSVWTSAPLRTAALEFFRKYPLAEVRGGHLVLPHVAPTPPDTSTALQLGTKLVTLLREASDRAPRLPQERPPVIDQTARPVTEAVPDKEAVAELASLEKPQPLESLEKPRGSPLPLVAAFAFGIATLATNANFWVVFGGGLLLAMIIVVVGREK